MALNLAAPAIVAACFAALALAYAYGVRFPNFRSRFFWRGFAEGFAAPLLLFRREGKGKV